METLAMILFVVTVKVVMLAVSLTLLFGSARLLRIVFEKFIFKRRS